MLEKLSYDKDPILLDEDPIEDYYDQSSQELDGLPQASYVHRETGKEEVNIFRVPYIWVPQEGLVRRYVQATKADVGGVGGHTKVSPRVKDAVLDTIIKYNSFTIDKKSRPIFTSAMVTHTGDDVCITWVIDEKVAEHPEVTGELLWDAFKAGEEVAIEEGDYGPGQDLRKDAYTGNIHGSGPASITLPLPFRDKNFSQTVLLATADKTEPGAYNYLTTGAYLDPRYNTGLLIADSAMAKGYAFEIIDLDTKAQALETGVPQNNPKALEEKMEELGKTEKYTMLYAPEDYYDISALDMSPSRYVVSKVYTRDKEGEAANLGAVVSAERLHNIKTEKGFVYGGKDDPVMLSLCQGDWPAPGEITSPIANIPLVAGDCRGSHYLHIYPMPINEPTSFWSGPIISVLTLSINLETGRIGAISDQFARGTPWDYFRLKAAEYMSHHRIAHGSKQPGTLPTDEIEYQPGYNKRMASLNFQRRPAP